eukprot:Em0001g3763a
MAVVSSTSSFLTNTPGREWKLVGFLNMTDPSKLCPDSWQNFTSPRSCGKKTTAPCDSLSIPTFEFRYQKVCGRFRGYQFGPPDAFHVSSFRVEDSYVDGVSITYGSPEKRQHVYTYAAGVSEKQDWDACPCAGGGVSAPSFVGSDYYCESGNPNAIFSTVWYSSDVLWDGQQCGGNEVYVTPTIITQPSDVLAVVNDNVTLVCEAEAFPPPQYQWEHIEGNLTGRSSMMGINRKKLELNEVMFGDEGSYICKLIVKNGTSDGGTYTCVVTNAAGSGSASATVYVTPTIITQPSDMLAVGNGNVTLVFSLLNMAVVSSTSPFLTNTPGLEWKLVGSLNMTDPSKLCPDSWQSFTSPRSCGKKTTAPCDSLSIPTFGFRYQNVCGRFRGYQLGSPDAFHVSSSFRVEDGYVDGVSITYGSPGKRQHVYTYAAGVSEKQDWDACSDYYCESGNPNTRVVLLGRSIGPTAVWWK